LGDKVALILGGGGFIGHHLARRLREYGYHVVGLDLKEPDFTPWNQDFDEFYKVDLRDSSMVMKAMERFKPDEVYQLAADMGGAGYIFTGEHDFAIMHNSAQINLNVANAVATHCPEAKIFYSSSACIYPQENQANPKDPKCNEDSAYPANPDSEYGWEKIFSERLYQSLSRYHDIPVRIARFHNIFGPEGTFDGGREKAPAALCRKISKAGAKDDIEVWGDGKQTRTFLYIDECVEAVHRLMDSDCTEVINIGSEEMVSINGLAMKIADVAGKDITIKNIPGPEGVRGRTSDNRLCEERLNWCPSMTLNEGLEKTYTWIHNQIQASR